MRAFLRWTLAVLWLAGLGAAAQALDIREGRTPRGIRYAFLPLPTEGSVALAFSWTDGYGQARPGLELVGRLGAAWMQAGTQALPEGQFREELRDDQIGLGLGSGGRFTAGNLSAPSSKLKVAAERLREVLQTPALADRALARVKRRQALGLEQAREVPATLARSLLLQAIGGDTPYVREGSVSASLRGAADRIGRAEVEGWRRAVLARDNLVVGAAGRASERDIAAAIDTAFGDLPERSDVPPLPDIRFTATARTIVVEREGSQTQLALGGGTGLLWAEEHLFPIASIAQSVLSGGPQSRLFRAVRDELGATYGTSSELPSLAASRRYLLITSAVDNATAGRALEVIRAEYARFRREGLQETEFQAARSRVVNAIEEEFRRSSSAANILRNVLRQQNQSPRDIPGRLEGLRTLELEEVNGRLRAQWPERPLTTVIVGPSAQGFAADCVVRRDEEPERCLGQP